MNEILIKSLMSKGITCLGVDEPLHNALNQMVTKHYSCSIVKKNNLPVGIVTERDLVRLLKQAGQCIDLTLPVADCMTSPVISLNENNTLFDAMVISRAQRIRHMPVVNDDNELVGLVTQSDLANAYFRVIELQAEMIENSVAAKTGELQQLNSELQALSMEDYLMKIGNRRAMEVDLGHTHSASLRYGHPYSVLLLDIDFFKRYNDHYGHQAGDHALIAVAEILQSNIRGADRLYRYGGEELLLVLPCTNASQAERVAKKLVASISKGVIPHEKSPFDVLTVSCGGACVLDNGELAGSWEELIKQVDNNLYDAKNAGRNRAVVSYTYEVEPAEASK